MNKENILDFLDDFDSSFKLRIETARVAFELKPNKWTQSRLYKLTRLKAIADWLRKEYS